MNRVARRTVGAYPLTARASDEAGHPVAVQAPASVTIVGPGETVVVNDAEAGISNGVMTYPLAVADAARLGEYHATWSGTVSGEQMSWETSFEIVTRSYLDLLSEARLALRISAEAYDSEIVGIIDAARDDLKLSGVSAAALEDPDPLVRRAIVVYCKAHFGLDNADSEKYMESFRSLETHLALSSEYGEPQE